MSEAVKGVRSEPWGCVWTEQGQGNGEAGGFSVFRDQQGASVVSAQGVWEEGKEMSSERSAGVEVGRCCGM